MLSRKSVAMPELWSNSSCQSEFQCWRGKRQSKKAGFPKVNEFNNTTLADEKKKEMTF